MPDEPPAEEFEPSAESEPAFADGEPAEDDECEGNTSSVPVHATAIELAIKAEVDQPDMCLDDIERLLTCS